ncbi:hypothetical protein [Streptomyces sp. MI02-7b]|uniref:hypothetical protein n=1 Tax=Streptomyces sp. MI02-7b TaxID=462941 RepID=UPI0029AE31C9|nr:hypothetical protein [Streptomyces sp. MI02-7b]MDX3072865.1 hypothetical protein [Streptomyces sp. MI02-7b]
MHGNPEPLAALAAPTGVTVRTRLRAEGPIVPPHATALLAKRTPGPAVAGTTASPSVTTRGRRRRAAPGRATRTGRTRRS